MAYESKTLENALIDTLTGDIQTQPVHGTIALDNANSPASKWFETLEEGDNGVLAGVYGEEMIWGYDVDGRSEFTSVTVASSIAYTVNSLYYFNEVTFGKYNNTAVLCKKALTTTASTISLLQLSSDGKSIIGETGEVFFELWDGNGFGDDNTFEQLTNGTITDLNGNTARTFHGSIALNGKVK